MTAVKIETAGAAERGAPILDINCRVIFPNVVFAGLVARALFYPKARMPIFARGCGLALVFILFVGAFMTIPSLSLDESIHTFWSMNEGSIGPLHWEFISLGWMSLAASTWRYKSSPIFLISSAQKRLRNR